MRQAVDAHDDSDEATAHLEESTESEAALETSRPASVPTATQVDPDEIGSEYFIG